VWLLTLCEQQERLVISDEHYVEVIKMIEMKKESAA
jgi:hypothetical protein